MRNKTLIFIVLIFLFLFSCRKINSYQEPVGNLNLDISFTMKYYPCLIDTACGCLSKTSDLWAYWEPNVLITDSNGNTVFSQKARKIHVSNFSLPEGKYSIRYSMELWGGIKTPYPDGITACDSVRDIWKWRFAPGYPEYCINKNKYRYKALDTTEIFVVNRKEQISLNRIFY
jgi:hypothetical protein